jgi:recombination protein RecA
MKPYRFVSFYKYETDHISVGSPIISKILKSKNNVLTRKTIYNTIRTENEHKFAWRKTMAKEREDKYKEINAAKSDKLKALDAAISQIEKQYGKGSIMKLGDNSAHMNVETSPTGSLSLDIALGLGGLPKGRIIEIYGPESSGKTTVALHCVAEVQKRGGIAGFIDAEHALDPVYAKNIGVDIDNLYISQPDCGEQALEITETMVRSGAVDIVIVDSVAALVPKAEIDGDMGDSHVGLQARLMSQALRKLTAVISKSNCIVIFINQLREKVGVMFGNPETTTGGRALKFYSSVRLDVRRIEALKQGGEVVGNRTRVKIVKNKVAPPFREAEFDIMFGQGISREGDILDLAADSGVVNKSGAWYAYNGEKIGQGRENAKTYLKENPMVCEEIEAKVRDFYKTDGAEEETEEEKTEAPAAKSIKTVVDEKAAEAAKKAEE